MSKTKVKPIPDGMHTVTPHLVCAGTADAIEFYKGHQWSVATHVRDVSPDEMQQAVQKACS